MDRGRPSGRNRGRCRLKRPPARWVDRDADLEALVDELVGCDAYGMDTEFHRERTYFPQLALVQIATSDWLALVDPLAVDIRLLLPAFESDAIAVMHAADQDIDVLTHACGAVPAQIFDTQLAAGFVGLSTPSLADLVRRVTGENVPKGSRLTDWLQRPLSEGQRTYAAADVEHLLLLHRELGESLRKVGRLDWARDEFEVLRTKPSGPPQASEAWRRIKEARGLRGRSRSVAAEVAGWRELRAAERDEPVRHVMPDIAVVAVAQQQPTDVDQLRQIRGIDGRHTRRGVVEELLDAVARGRATDVEDLPKAGGDSLERQLRPAATLVSAWLAQLGRDLRIAPSVLATRADIQGFLASDPDSRLARGWRHDLVGAHVRRVVDGEVAVVFDRRGRLALEERSGHAVDVVLPVPDAEWL